MDLQHSEWDVFMRGVAPGSVNDRIIGMIYGHALGDAVGLQSEFKMSDDEMKIEFPYARPIRDYPKCDWTDDTDHVILVMQSLIANDMKYDARDFAKRLKDWSNNGFPELGDTTGLGLGGTTNMVIIHPNFLTNPNAAASDVWTKAGKRIAPNGSLMRTSIVGTLPELENVVSIAADLSLTTHADPRCVASCVFQSVAVNGLIYGDIMDSTDIDNIVKVALDISSSHTRGTTWRASEEVERRIRGVPKSFTDTRFADNDQEFRHWVNLAYSGDLDVLKLDDSPTIGFVLKCLGCSIYALQMIRHAKKFNGTISFKKFVTKIALEAGDADTNCAVSGAIMGAHLGYSKLPTDWLASLPNKKWLDKIIMDYLAHLPKSFINHATSPGDLRMSAAT